MKGTIHTIPTVLVSLLLPVATLFAQAPGQQQQQPEFIKQGQQLMWEGKLDEALALYRNILQLSPNSVAANIAAGSVLDLLGQGEEARDYLAKATEGADTPEQKNNGAKGDGNVVCLRGKLQENRPV
jgi:tetratricopeptide (TPR) repeat protein